MDYWDYTTYIQNIIRENTLCHHGVKGQEWGKRKYQYEDGSLTPAGKAHYGVGDGDDRRRSSYNNKRTNYNSQNKSNSNNNELTEEEQAQAERERKAARNKKIAIAAGITAAAVIGIVVAKKYHDKSIQNQQLQQQLLDGQKRLELLSNDNEALNLSLADSKKRLNLLSEDNELLKTSLDEANDRVSLLRGTNKWQAGKIVDLQKANEQQKAVNQNLAKTNSFLSGQTRKYKTERDVAVSALNNKNNQLANKLLQEKRTTQKFAKEAAQGRLEISRLKSINQTLAASNSKNRQAIEQLGGSNSPVIRNTVAKVLGSLNANVFKNK